MHIKTYLAVGALALLLFAGGLPLAARAETPVVDPKVVDLRQLPTLDRIIPLLADKRVVFVGETHDRYSHHLVQLAVIRAMHTRHPDLAIGLEFFQQPYQEHLDAYIAGDIDEVTMLRRTEYFDRWRFDYRLYRPILQYAREHGIPLVALNVPAELTREVAEGGFNGLSEALRGELPEVARDDARYRQRLEAIYASHPQGDNADFENFLDAQLLWDEGMAERAAEYLKRHAERKMVILAGTGHIAWGIGIPQRLARRIEVDYATLINDPQERLSPGLADFVLLPEPQDLPPPGRLGIYMVSAPTGVRIERFAEDSPAAGAGLKPGDRIVEVEGQPIGNPADVHLTLLGREPGQTVELAVVRERWLEADEQLTYRVELH